MNNVIRYSETYGNPSALRAEAMDALSTWAKPSVLDRVDGRYRGAVTRDPAVVKTKASGLYTKLATNSEASIRRSAIRAISKLSMTTASPVLLERLKMDGDAEIRVEALRALAALNDKQIGKAIETALADGDKRVRVAAIDLIGKTR